jgi:type II secretory pathway pseudopilin PulG
MRRKRLGVTLVEMLVVFAIISVLIGLLLPAVQASRERARETVCKNNVHQLEIAINLFRETHRRLPDSAGPRQIGGWSFEVLPFLGASNLYDDYLVGTPIADAPASLFRQPAVMRCPSRTAFNDDSSEVNCSHFVFTPCGRRESWALYDAPISLERPWLNGPELAVESLRKSVGPHHGGFHFTHSGGGVNLLIDGATVY